MTSDSRTVRYLCWKFLHNEELWLNLAIFNWKQSTHINYLFVELKVYELPFSSEKKLIGRISTQAELHCVYFGTVLCLLFSPKMSGKFASMRRAARARTQSLMHLPKINVFNVNKTTFLEASKQRGNETMSWTALRIQTDKKKDKAERENAFKRCFALASISIKFFHLTRFSLPSFFSLLLRFIEYSIWVILFFFSARYWAVSCKVHSYNIFFE